MTRTSVLGKATKVDALREDHDVVEVVNQAVASATHVIVRRDGGEEIELPEALIKILRASAQELSAGRSVTVLASETVLTPAEAAELLGLSRPFVARLLDEGRIPSENLPGSTHRVVRLADLLAFQAQRERRRAGTDRLAEIVESEDLPY
jgi:excisionase family DNA binding protein